MSGKKEIVIKDACILFDLVDLNLLEDFFQLDVIAFTTPQVIGEITQEQQYVEVSKSIANGKLQIDNQGKFEAIASIYEEHSGLSIPDSSVLEVAIRRNAIIYSSDGSLRKISVNNNLTVRGILWVIDELYSKDFLSKELAIEKLNMYESINQRAPSKEIKILISKIFNK